MLRRDIFKKGENDDHIIGRTMKARLVQLVGLSIQFQMRIVVMRYQGMDRQLRCDRQGKKPEQPTRYYPSYRLMLEQSSF